MIKYGILLIFEKIEEILILIIFDYLTSCYIDDLSKSREDFTHYDRAYSDYTSSHIWDINTCNEAVQCGHMSYKEIQSCHLYHKTYFHIQSTPIINHNLDIKNIIGSKKCKPFNKSDVCKNKHKEF
jgi:hypothetical protein